MDLKLLNNLKLGRTPVDKVWVKHHTLEDETRLISLTEFFLNLSKKRKVKTEAEAAEAAAKAGTWTPQDERTLSDTITYLNGMQESYAKVIESQKKYLKEELDKTEERIRNLKVKKISAIGLTAEQVANKMANERFILSLFYKDEDLNLRCFSDDDIEYLEEEELIKYYNLFGEFKKLTEDKAIKKLAASAYAQNLYFISGKGSAFFNKGVLDLTVLQQHFLMYLQSYKHIISNLVGKVSSENLNDYEFLEKWSSAGEKAREQIENKSSQRQAGGPTFDSIRRAANKDTNTLTDHVNNIKAVL